MTKNLEEVSFAEAGSVLQVEFKKEQGLAEQYLQEANAKDLYELYQKRCGQLEDFGRTMSVLAEMNAGKHHRPTQSISPDAIASMEKVALAAIDLAISVTTGKD